MFFSNFNSVVGLINPRFSRVFIILMVVVGMSSVFYACDKEEVVDERSDLHINRTFPKNGSFAPRMEHPFAVVYLNKSADVDSLRNEISMLVADEKGAMQSYTTSFGDEKRTTELRIYCDGIVPSKKYYVTLRGTNLYYRFGFTMR